MDGLKITQAGNIVNRGQTDSFTRIGGELGVQRPEAPGVDEKGGASFADSLNQAIGKVNELQQVSDKKMQELAVGEAKSIPDVMMAAEKADIALRLMTKVRNKVIDAYQEIMRMQV